jgi:hypothetical protein
MPEKIDYKVELRKLEVKVNFWKPNEGKYTVVFLSEPETVDYVKPTGEVIKQWKFLVEVDGTKEPMVWTIPLSNTVTSLRGQLIKLGAQEDRLSGKKCTILVQGNGKERRYTVPEAI